MSPSAALRLGRAEWLAVLLGSALMLLVHAPDVAWARGAIAFAGIDLVGFAPGAVLRRASGGRPAPRACAYLYNFTHNLGTAVGVVAVWAACAGFEWAMLAIPLHLAGDRGLFGNGFQTRSES